MASALQAGVAGALEADIERFAAALRCVAERTPAPVTGAEQRWLHQRYIEFSMRLGRDFHARAHRPAAAPCAFLPLESTVHVWADTSADPRQTLRAWVDVYATGFARHHEVPLAWRAARLLARTYATSRRQAQIARDLFTSPSTLARHFSAAFGLEIAEYRTRLRLVHAFEMLRTRNVKVEHAASAVGFRSLASFNAATKRSTGTVPSAVRSLAPPAYQRLLDTELEVDPAILEQQWRRRRERGGGAPDLRPRRSVRSTLSVAWLTLWTNGMTMMGERFFATFAGFGSS